MIRRLEPQVARVEEVVAVVMRIVEAKDTGLGTVGRRFAGGDAVDAGP